MNKFLACKTVLKDIEENGPKTFQGFYDSKMVMRILCMEFVQ